MLQCLLGVGCTSHLNHRAVFQIPLLEGTTTSPASLASINMLSLKAATSVLWVHTRAAQTVETRAPIAQRVGMASLAVLRLTSPTAPSVRAATTGCLCRPPPVRPAQQVGTANSPARRTRLAQPSARRIFLQRAHRGPQAQWRLSSGFTWLMLRPKSRDRVQRASSNQA